MPPLSLDDLPSDGRMSFEGLVPPPRFRTTSFESYRPQHPSQREAERSVAAFVAAPPRPAGLRLFRRRPPPGGGLYLDGGFGVGKTHLLAAAFHASEAETKAYLSFQELVYLIGVFGRPEAFERFGDRELYCLDEFELDDPGNTLIVKTFLAEVFARGARVLTTSNTPPEAQGRGRFNADDFAREIQSIAARFATQRIDGPDYRQRARLGAFAPIERVAARLDAAGDDAVSADWAGLLDYLKRVHPIRYRAAFAGVRTLIVEGVAPLPDQNDALRFVHLIDKLYDLEVAIVATGRGAVGELFDESYRRGAFAKKYERCLSRLSELLREGEGGA